MFKFLGLLKAKSTLLLVLALLASLSFATVQTLRLDTANAAITSTASANKLLTERVNSDRQLIATRDALIAEQNAAVQALVTASQADRTAYLGRIAAAEKVAKVQEANARSILARETTATDELGRARAALALIIETLQAERSPDVRQ